MAGKNVKARDPLAALTSAQKKKLKDPAFVIALHATKPLVAMVSKRKAKRSS